MEYTPQVLAQVRQKIGETIPSGGAASDTMFTDNEIMVWILAAPTLNHAVVEGWEAKLAHFANLVDVTDGASSRKLGELRLAAEEALKYYRGRIALGPTDGLARTRTRIGKIVRHG